MKNISLLEYALLGLLCRSAFCGYELRKIFADTPMGTFSDSPGAIYPALRRLQSRRLIAGTIEKSAGLRRRETFRLTPQGYKSLEGWLRTAVGRRDLTGRTHDLSLRFAFIEPMLGQRAAIAFLRSLERELESYISLLRGSRKAMKPAKLLSPRLALDRGIAGYEAYLRWAKRAIAAYQRGANAMPHGREISPRSSNPPRRKG